jgi:hypothetical protein
MKIIFNGLDHSFKFKNMRYKREVQSILCFIKHISTPLSLYYDLCIVRSSRAMDQFFIFKI